MADQRLIEALLPQVDKIEEFIGNLRKSLLQARARGEPIWVGQTRHTVPVTVRGMPDQLITGCTLIIKTGQIALEEQVRMMAEKEKTYFIDKMAAERKDHT